MEKAEHAVGKIGVIVDALDGIDRAAGDDVVVFTCSTNPKQYYSKVRDPFYTYHISGEKEIYDLAARADLDGYIIPADYFLIRNLWESFCGSSRSGQGFPPPSTEKNTQNNVGSSTYCCSYGGKWNEE